MHQKVFCFGIGATNWVDLSSLTFSFEIDTIMNKWRRDSRVTFGVASTSSFCAAPAVFGSAAESEENPSIRC